MSETNEMTKIENREKVKTMLLSEYWLPKYDRLFSDNFTIDFPNAPPGMPQNMNPFNARCFKNWMSRTVKTWTVEPDYELYGTPDPGNFWAVRTCSGDVFWAGVNGHFKSKMVTNVTIENGEITHIKELFDPLQFLKAIGREAPVFRVDLTDERVLKFRKEAGSRMTPPPASNIDMSPEAIEKRRRNNLDAYRQADHYKAIMELLSVTEDCAHQVYFLPPEMKDAYYGEELELIEAWSGASCQKLVFDTGGVCHATDDPNVYFCEFSCFGDTDWIGNNAPGKYRNNYFYILRFADDGRLRCVEEYLNPINKFNSINVSIPSFPYYF
jgi:ketosteroid isomerase-like protein